MKRIISMVLALLILMPSLTAFASSDDEILDALFDSEYLSGELNYRITIDSKLPLPAFLDADGNITEMLSNAEFLYNIKYDTSEDKKKTQAEMDICISLQGMDSLNMKYWIDFDLSDTENLKYKIIMKLADSEKFMYMDLVNDPDSTEVQIMSDYIDNINAVRSEFTKDYKSKLIPEYKEGKYVIILDEKVVKDLLKDIFTRISSIAFNYFAVSSAEAKTTGSSVGIIGGADGPTAVFITEGNVSEDNSIEVFDTDEIMQEFEKEIAEFFEKLKNVQLFDENAVVIEIELDDRNLIKNQKATINIKTNLAELMELYNTQNETVTKENSDIELSIVMDLSYSKINEQIDIEFPELTEENSIDLMNVFPEESPIDENKINVIANGRIMKSDVDPVIKDDKVYVPVRAFLNTIGVSDDDIVYIHKGKVDINYFGTEVKLIIGSDIAKINGKEVILDEPIFTVGDRTMVSTDFISETFNCYVDWSPFYNDEGEPLAAGILYISTRTESRVLNIMIPSSMTAEEVKILDEASFYTGINANIVTVPIDNYKEKVMVMIAAGEPCAFLNWEFDDEWKQRWIEMDLFVPLEKLIEEYAPNIMNYLEENPDIRKVITSDDGHIYYIPLLQLDKEGSCGFSLTKTVRNPEDVIMWLDYLFTEQIHQH
ncbi:MAG TPA: extracellular solute-binding protein [Clostridiaceae bacterium]|nr:extracellular solute-binding protein [Clostridiaceae bacterium]